MGQFKALSKKNWILWKRSWCGNIVEVLVPILFLFFFALNRQLIDIRTYEEQQYLTNSSYTRTLYGQ
jgi:hypothetical protein